MSLRKQRRDANTARPQRTRASRVALIGLLGIAVVLLTGCSQEWKNLAMPDPVTEEAPHIFLLWRWSWVAALITGGIVWGLMFYAAFRFRRRSDDDVPVQTRYNLPLEVFYTIFPILMVIVLFRWVLVVQDEILDEVPDPDVTVEVTGQQWSWTFNTGIGDCAPNTDVEAGEIACDEYAYEVGTASEIPTLVLPVDQTVQFNLRSPDVIHSFNVQSFLFRLDVVPGRVNHFQATPNKEGTYKGKCTELCGTYHSRMLFNVEVVSQNEFEDYLAEREAAGLVSDEPLLGGADAITQAGLDDEEGDE